MTLEAKVGLLQDRLTVDGKEYPLRRERGWVLVPGLPSVKGSRVRYDALRDRIRIEGPAGYVNVRFGLRRSMFSWRGQQYRVGPMVWGHVMVSRGERPVATGRVTMSGVRLGYVAAELEPIAPGLAVGLAYRATAFWLAAGAAVH